MRQDSLSRATGQRRHLQTEIQQLRGSLAAVQAETESQRLDLSRVRDERATLETRSRLLQQALDRGTFDVAATDTCRDPELDAAERHLADVEAQLRTKELALTHAEEQTAKLQEEHQRVAIVDKRLECADQKNKELFAEVREIERRQEQLESDAAVRAREDPLGLSAGGNGQVVAAATRDPEAARAENEHLRAEVWRLRARAGARSGGAGSAADLEQQQAKRQLKRVKTATKKYVKDFREGIFGLLGWKAEVVSDDGGQQWRFTSKYREGEELLFAKNPAEESGQRPTFDILATDWAEQLMEDRQAIAYIEVFRSFPGLLAHVTMDGLSREVAAADDLDPASLGEDSRGPELRGLQQDNQSLREAVARGGASPLRGTRGS